MIVIFILILFLFLHLTTQSGLELISFETAETAKVVSLAEALTIIAIKRKRQSVQQPTATDQEPQHRLSVQIVLSA